MGQITPSLRSLELECFKMKKRLRKAKTDTAVFPYRFPRDMKHTPFLVLSTLKNPDVKWGLADICSYSSGPAQATCSQVMSWGRAEGLGLQAVKEDTCKLKLKCWGVTKVAVNPWGQLLLCPTFKGWTHLKRTQALNKDNDINCPMVWLWSILPHPV